MKLEIFPIELGEPWKLSDGMQGVAVPVLVKETPTSRGYKINTELEKGEIEFTDTGNISKLKIKNNTDEYAFFRQGTVLKGKTQTRVLQASILVQPNVETLADIRCIYASKGIRSGATMTTMKNYTPHNVTQNLKAGQSQTWSAATDYSAYALSASSISADGISGYINIRRDNLADFMEVDTKRIDEALKNIPADHIRQIGLIVVDLNGVAGMEIFDHPDSWIAVSQAVVRSYEKILTNAMPEIYDINMDKVKEHVFAFLQKLQNADSDEIYSSGDSATYQIMHDEITGDFTTLDDGLVHLLASRRLKHPKRITTRRAWPLTTQVAPTPTVEWRWEQTPEIPTAGGGTDDSKRYSDTVLHMTKPRGYNVMSAMVDGPKTFGEIEQSTGMSSRTVSGGLTDARELGLVQKVIRTNGSPSYTLTVEGLRTNPKKFKAMYEGY